MLEKWLTYKLIRFWIVFNIFLILFNLWIPKKLKKPIWEMPVVTQTLNIYNLRVKSAKSFNMKASETLLNIHWKMLKQRQCLLWAFATYCCPYVRRYWDQPSGVHRAKGLKFQQKTKKILVFLWNCFKSD